MKIKVLVFGSNGMVGSSIIRLMKKSEKVSDLLASTRKDTDLFLLNDTKKTIEKFNPDLIINAAARLGINANNTHRTEFIIENLKINMNILESIVDYPNVKVINLGSSCIYPLDSPNQLKKNFYGWKARTY